MDLKEYQEFTKTTVVYSEEVALPYLFSGLTSETGEVTGLYKKHLRGDCTYDELRFKLKFELGDVFWYLARICDEFGFSVEEILDINVDKLRIRQKNNTLKGSGDDR